MGKRKASWILRKVIRKGGGVTRLARAMRLPVPTVRTWATRGRIPEEYWLELAELEVVTLEKLARHAAKRRTHVQARAAQVAPGSGALDETDMRLPGRRDPGGD